MRFIKLGSAIALIVTFYCIAVNDNSLYEYIFLLPLFYAISSIVFVISLRNKNTYGLNLVFGIAQSLVFIRYVVTPFFTIFSSRFTAWGWGPNPTSKEMLVAELLMCIEECLVFFIQYVAIKKYSRKKYLRKIRKDSKNKEKYWFLVLYVVLAGIVVLIVQPSLLLMENYFMYTGESGVNEVSMQGMYVILADTFKKVFLIIALILCKKGYDKHENKLYLFLAVLAVVVNMALNTGGTRIRMVFSLILGIYFLIYIFGKIPKLFYAIGGILCVISFLSVSTVKFSYAIGNVSNPVLTVISIMCGQFQDYFAGPRLVGQMLNVHKIYGNSIGIGTFINDFMGSVPIVSNIINQTNRINYYFNIYCNMKNQTLIAPILGIGFCYFPIFPFFFSMIFEYCVIKLDYLMTATNRITYKYLYAYMGYVCAMCMGYSTQNIYAQFANAFVPLFILFKINDKMRLRMVRQRNVWK